MHVIPALEVAEAALRELNNIFQEKEAEFLRKEEALGVKWSNAQSSYAGTREMAAVLLALERYRNADRPS